MNSGQKVTTDWFTAITWRVLRIQVPETHLPCVSTQAILAPYRNTDSSSLGLWLIAVFAVLAILSGNPSLAEVRKETGPQVVKPGADRYGGVWHQGKDSGVFVPLHAGMMWADVLQYRILWGRQNSFRITDIEVDSTSCPSNQGGPFATKWEKGSWQDRLAIYYSLAAFKTAIHNQWKLGFQLVDFEIWGGHCQNIGPAYIALYREAVPSPYRTPPKVDSTWLTSLQSTINDYAKSGYKLVDFEIDKAPMNQSLPSPVEALGVWYAGSAKQEYLVLERSQFEAEMTNRDSTSTLMDMESDRLKLYPQKPPTRYVAALWENFSKNNIDEHEVGEVYTKFKELIWLQDHSRKMIDFEVYPNTIDKRFGVVFGKYLNNLGGGSAYAVLQAGELIAGSAHGWARRAFTDPNNGTQYPGKVMELDTRGPVASVTKFFTALGVLRYAETRHFPHGYRWVDEWLDEPMIHHLPIDFHSFGPGVETVTIRDLLRQTTGLAEFTARKISIDNLLGPTHNSARWRKDMRDWLSQPLADSSKAYKYQNIHFELLALIMDEVELPGVISSLTPWHDWMNQQVFANAGVGPLLCEPTNGDALSYPLTFSTQGVEWINSWPCNGYGTGIGAFYASTLDLAKVSAAVREGKILSTVTARKIFEQGLGLDPPYPDGDGKIETGGEELYTKNGGLCGNNSQGQVSGTETLIARYDDYNFDDDGLHYLGMGSPKNDYIYEVGFLDFDFGIMIHSSPYSVGMPCPSKEFATPRNFPTPKEMLQEAFLLPENW